MSGTICKCCKDEGGAGDFIVDGLCVWCISETLSENTISQKAKDARIAELEAALREIIAVINDEGGYERTELALEIAYNTLVISSKEQNK